MKNRIIWLWFVLSFLACEEPVDWELDTIQSEDLVVEAILTNERKTHQIKITKPHIELNGKSEGVNNAEVLVSANGQSVSFLNDGRENGIYKSEFPFRVVDNIEYNLKVTWQGNEYEASSSLSDVAPIPEIGFDTIRRKDTITNLRTLNNISIPFNPNQQAMYEVFIQFDTTIVKMVSYVFSDIDISEVQTPEQEQIQFPVGSRVRVRKYGLNDDYATFLRAMAIETIWDGTLFYTSGSNLPTNISGGMHGFFSTCAVLEEDIIVE